VRGWGSFTGDPKVWLRKILKTGISRCEGSVGQPVLVSFARDFVRWMKGALEVDRPSLCGNLEGNLECGTFTGDLEC